MSAIGGIVNFNDAPVDDAVLTQLGRDLGAYGPDGGFDVRQNSIGMIYRAFHTNRESRSERQPLKHPDGCTLAWDGRLDNREELITLLRSELRDDRTDCALVMAAYKKWGIAFLQRIIGDFALSLWDSNLKTLFLARDIVGARLLFYHANNERLIWSSRLESLLEVPDIQLEVNDEYVAGYLSIYPKPNLTPYKNIYAVPPAHFLSARCRKVYTHRFWGLDPANEIRYQTDQQYEEHFLNLFSEAIRARLRVDGPVWSDLSGGLDSSSIVCVADEITKKDSVQATSLETVSAVFDESLTSDEQRFIRLVEEKRGQNGHHFTESECPLLVDSMPEGFRAIPNSIELFGKYHTAVREQMRAQGARVLLSGIGGDELLTASFDPSPELADLLVQVKLSELNRRLQAWSLALKKPYLEVLINYSLVPSLPRQVQARYKRRQRTKRISLLEPRFTKSFRLHDMLLGPKDIFGFGLPSSRGQSVAYLSVTDCISPGHLLVWGPADISYPFTHRPLVEFLQAIPPTQWIRPGETRSLMRRSLRAYLPPQIVKRKGKGNPAEATVRALKREWPRLSELLKDALVCAAGYVNPARLKALIEQPDFERNLESLAAIRIYYLELWLRDLERRSRTVKHTATVEISASSNQPERVMHAYS